MTARRSDFLKSILILPALLLGLEVVVRVVSTFGDDRSATAEAEVDPGFRLSKELGWERQPGFNGWADGGIRAFDAEGLHSVDTGQAADPETPKVLFLGASTTYGYNVPTDSTFTEVADRQLPGVDAINLGVIGYSSWQGRTLLRGALERFRPALVVAEFGFNDRRWVPPGEADGAALFARRYAAAHGVPGRVMRWLRVWHTVAALRSLLVRVGVVHEVVAPERLDAVIPRVDPQSYRENMAAIAAMAREAGAQVLFVQLEDSPLATRDLREGSALLDSGEYALAIPHLRQAATSTGSFRDLARIRLAEALDATGDRGAASYFLQIRDMPPSLDGQMPIRPASEYGEILRQVADSSSVPLLDVAPLVDGHPEYFGDDNHLNIAGHHVLGAALAPRIAALLAGDTTK